MASHYRTLLPTDFSGDPFELYDVERSPPPGRPWVLANFVAGLDGAVAVDGRVGPLTSPSDQQLFHHLRGLADVVLVGAGTVRAERYGPARTDARLEAVRTERGQEPVPPIAVVSASLTFDLGSRFFTEARARPIVVCPSASDPERRAQLAERAEVLVAGGQDVDLDGALRTLHDRGVRTVLCEGGPALLAELLEAGLLDELCLTVAPVTGGDALRLVGGDARPALTGFTLQHVVAHDHELYLRYLIQGPLDRG